MPVIKAFFISYSSADFADLRRLFEVRIKLRNCESLVRLFIRRFRRFTQIVSEGKNLRNCKLGVPKLRRCPFYTSADCADLRRLFSERINLRNCKLGALKLSRSPFLKPIAFK